MTTRSDSQMDEWRQALKRAAGTCGTVIIPRRSISGKLVSGQVWRRRHGAKWAYKKFVEYADRDITGSGARHEAPIR